MLVLSRRQQQSIVIDQGIRVTVLEVRGHVVRLGIDAPKEIPIQRSELRKQARPFKSTDPLRR